MSKVLQFPMNQSPPIIGADISAYLADRNDPNNIKHFDWDKYPGQFALLRCTVATAGFDFEFDYNVNQCIQRGIPFGIWHYAKLWHSIPKQVELFAGVINKYKDHPLFLGNLTKDKRGAYLDVEQNDGQDKNTFTGNNQKMVIQLRNATGILVGEYSRASFIDANTYRNDWMKDMDWWIAHWFTGINPNAVPNARPYLPDNIAAINNPIEPVFWQFDSPKLGREWGSMGDDNIDLNWFTWNGGTYSAFKQKFNVDALVVQPPQPPPPPSTDIWATMLIDQMSVRSDPTYIASGDNLFAKGLVNKKVKLLRDEIVNGYVPVEAWIWNNSLKRI